MDIRAILLDFDGTALQKDQVYISLRDMAALKAAMSKGIEIIPCTGRVEDMFPPQIEKEKEIRYWVTSNGGRIVDRVTGEVIYEDCFTPEQSAQLCRIFEGQNLYCEVAANGKIYLEKEINDHLEDCSVPPHHIWFVDEGRQIAVEKMSEYFLEHRICVEKFNLYDVPAQKKEAMYQLFEDTGLVHLTDGTGDDIQIFPKWQSRAHGVDTLLQHLGITFGCVMSLGDSLLDLPMIERAKIGVAMSNAPAEVREKADYVTASNVDCGVAKAIEKFLL